MARREPPRQPRLTRQAYDDAVSALLRDWPAFIRINPSEQLVLYAGELAAQHRLKGYDAVQLASAIEFARRSTETFLFSTWDKALATAAQSEGLELAHEVTI